MIDSSGDYSEAEKLTEVEEIFNLIKKMSSTDENVAQEAFKEAGKFLNGKDKKSGFDKTIINKNGSNIDKKSVNSQPANDVAAFMSAVAQDAEERSKRRAKQRERADKLKERANSFFKAGDWKRAIDLYSQAISLAKDWDVLYTNRAQAYLRSGQPELALKDCDTALLLFPEVPDLSKLKSMVTNDGSVPSNPRLAKIYLHRGKALMALSQPLDAIEAYTLSRIYSNVTNINNTSMWPNYLVEYVAQAQAALAVQIADKKAELSFEQYAIGDTQESLSASKQLICLLAQLARGNQTSKYYSAGLRQLTYLLTNAPRAQTTDNHESTDTDVNSSVKMNGCLKSETNILSNKTCPEVVGGGSACSNRKKRSANKNKQSTLNKSQQISSSILNNQENKVNKQQMNNLSTSETLSDLQTIFRVKNGFTLLDKEVNAIYRIFNFDSSNQINPDFQSSQTVSSNHTNGQPITIDHPPLDVTDRMLALLNLADQLTMDCAENQRILVERQPNLIRISLACLQLSSQFIQCITGSSEADINDNESEFSDTQHQYHVLGALRAAACNLLATVISLPSGRQALLDTFGPGQLLTGVANCLATSLCPNQTSSSARSLNSRDLSQGLSSFSKSKPNKINPIKSNLISPALASICAAKAAQILEYLVESPRFLILARSSPDGLQGLLEVIESALNVPNSNSSVGLTISNGYCISNLLDSLSNACHDIKLQRNILQTRKPLLYALADCLVRHALLLEDSGHAHLVSSICRLLHNLYVGQFNRLNANDCVSGGSSSSDSPAFSPISDSKLIDTILNGVGAILDQPHHGPELRAVAIALAGRLLPRCQTKQLVSWFGEADNSSLSTKDLPGRTRLLLAIFDCCSYPSVSDDQSNSSTTETATSSHSSESSLNENNLSNHLLGGCIRCLAAGTNYSIALRYAVGDDRKRVRRLGRLIKVRIPGSNISQNKSKTGACPPQPPPRDESIAGNVCLILQHCVDDTPLAEYLQGTKIIYELLSLIQESQRLETKRNAAILIGKLAQSNQVHRDELSYLDGYSILARFNSWTAALDRS